LLIHFEEYTAKDGKAKHDVTYITLILNVPTSIHVVYVSFI